MRLVTTRTGSVLLALLIVVGSLAMPVSAGLPDPPDRPNDADLPVVVNGSYDGGIVVAREFERKRTNRVSVTTVDCNETAIVPKHLTRENEFGLSLAGPLTDEQVDGVEQAIEDFRPPDEGSGSDSASIGKDEKGRIVHANEFIHVHYRIYLAGESGGEHVGTIHVERFLGPSVERNATDCKNPATVNKRQGDDGGADGKNGTDGDGEDGDGEDWFDVLPFDDWFDGWFGNDRSGREDRNDGADGQSADGGTWSTGMETSGEAVDLLHENVHDARVPGYVDRFVRDRRLNVGIDGEYVGVRTGPDGTPETIRTRAYENPDGTVVTDGETLHEIREADDPIGAVREAIVEDRLEYRTADPVAKWAFHALESGLRLGRTVDRAIPAAIDVGSGG